MAGDVDEKKRRDFMHTIHVLTASSSGGAGSAEVPRL